MTQLAKHAWITRFLFPKNGDGRNNIYILEFENPKNEEELLLKFYDLLQTFSEEVGGSYRVPVQMERGRFVIDGPKGFAIIEVAPAYTEEEYNQIVGEPLKETYDLSIWEGMFTGPELPKEQSDERHSQTKE